MTANAAARRCVFIVIAHDGDVGGEVGFGFLIHPPGLRMRSSMRCEASHHPRRESLEYIVLHPDTKTVCPQELNR
jgi:hypothetical protein